MPDQFIARLGTLLIFAGFFLALVALLLPGLRGRRSNARGGAVIIVGPFPIILASDREAAKTLLVLAILLVAILVGFFLLQSFL